MVRLVIGLIVLALASVWCGAADIGAPTPKSGDALITGADQTERYVPYLNGKRVALVGNPTSIIGGKPSVDVLLAMGVRVVKVFGPEHGFRGNASNGTAVGDEVDEKTGLPIISLYGKK